MVNFQLKLKVETQAQGLEHRSLIQELVILRIFKVKARERFLANLNFLACKETSEIFDDGVKANSLVINQLIARHDVREQLLLSYLLAQ